MDTYTTPQLLDVAELPEHIFKAWCRRRHLRLSSGDSVGTGNRRRHDKTDVLQAAALVKLGRVGVAPARAAKFWPVIASALHHAEALLILAPRGNDSDTDYRLVLPGGDAEMEHPNAPSVVAVVNIGALKREVAGKLAALS